MTRLRRVTVAAMSSVALGITLTAVPAQAMPAREGSGSVGCFEPASTGAGARSATGERQADHRDVSRRQQRAIERRTARILDRQGVTAGETTQLAATVPVYVHVMADKAGVGNATDTQISNQIAVLNKTFGGQESTAAANTGFTFTLTKTDRYYNSTWHADRQSTTYRSKTRLGGANALNIWLVDFKYLGIATFPWDYAANPKIDGIRVNVNSLPGGSIANYNLGETATHEAGHWFGLYHTFQGGCTTTNDSVGDTPAQSSGSEGCPEGRD
nr:zinc metalloprotease [Nocardioidaceae bacterium]